MKVFRYAALAWAAAAGLLLFSINFQAQEAEPAPAEDSEPVLVERAYDVRGLSQLELALQPPNGGIGDVLAPDHLFSGGAGDHEPDTWTLRDSGDEARCWEDKVDLMHRLLEFCNFHAESAEVISHERGDPAKVELQASEALHSRIKWALEALREVVRARVSVKVYKLPQGGEVGPGVLTSAQAAQAAKNSRLVGTMRGGLGERMVLQRVQHQSYLADYSLTVATGTSVAQSEVRDLRTGEEVVAGAIVLPNGKIWLQGWHAAMRLSELRTFETSCGKVELPRVAYNYTPMSAIMERGSAAILDAGPSGRFLAIADCDTEIKTRTLELGDGISLGLINATGCLHGMGPATRWMMTPNRLAVANDGVPVEQIIVEEPVDGPYNDAAIVMAEYLSPRFSSDWIQFQVVGPFLGVRVLPPSDDADEQKEFGRLRARVQQELGVALGEPRSCTLRVRAWVVSPSDKLPEGIVDGKPSERALAALGQAVLDRTTTAAGEQRVDFLDLSMAAHVRDYQTMAATEASGLDPLIGTLVTGRQVRWLVRGGEAGRVQLELRAGITVSDEKFESIAWGEAKKWSVERSKSDLSQLELVAELATGERSCTVCPAAGAEGSLIVLVAERIK